MIYSVHKYHAPITVPEAEGRTGSIRLIPYSTEAYSLEREITSYIYAINYQENTLYREQTLCRVL